jgi:6-hydroxynicotinate 3-monooxygenase
MQVRNCTKWWGPNSHFLIYYIEQSRDEIYLVTSAKGEWHSQASWEFCPREEVVNAFAGFHPEVRTVIETAPQLTKWPILDIEPVDIWSKGRLVRMSRVTKVQRISAENSFLRHPTDPTWVFGYNAVTVPLGPQQQ